jgi:hypothetical protein
MLTLSLIIPLLIVALIMSDIAAGIVAEGITKIIGGTR